jgi:hypothetical protein
MRLRFSELYGWELPRQQTTGRPAAFISFLILIEELRSEEVPQDQVEIELFYSLDTIYDNFFARG